MEYTIGVKHGHMPYTIGNKSSHMPHTLGSKVSYSLPNKKGGVSHHTSSNHHDIQDNGYKNEVFHEPLGLSKPKLQKSKNLSLEK